MTSREQEPELDPEALRARYRTERQKRLRDDGNAQYLRFEGQAAAYLEGMQGPPPARAPHEDEVEAVVVGGGFGGQLSAVRLKQAGIDNVRIIDSAGDFGGTWYWNRYPGISCDIESYTYLPLLEETGYMPPAKYASGAEILEHARRIGRTFGLYDNVCFRTRVTELRWLDEARRWLVSTDRGDRIRARYVAMALGPLNVPKLPGIPGIEDFAGHAFHACRWDYAYTGGDANGGLTGLSDKRVGIIGTGATAVQCVPHLAAHAAHLYVFQRTPSSVDVKHNVPTDPAWVASLEPGWHQRRMDNFNTLVSGGYADEDLVGDGWTEIFHRVMARIKAGQAASLSPEDIAATIELADFEKMELIRARVDASVQDPAVAEALKPYYRQLCKRPCIHNDYLPTFNRDNVSLVDTAGKGVERITPKGVVVDGRTYEVDCLIYASGFEVGTPYTRRAGYEVIGRQGRRLSEYWAGGVRSLHGMHVHGFPNCFLLSGAQSGFTASYPHMLAEQARHLAYVAGEAQRRGAAQVEASAAAEQGWVDTVVGLAGVRTKFLEACTPGYYNNEGKPGERGAQNGFYGGGSLRFIKLLQAWRDAGALEGLQLMGGANPVATDN